MSFDLELTSPAIPASVPKAKPKPRVIFDPDYQPEPGRVQVWSCGGGTQSAAIAALIVSGELPKPDFSLIVDTGREKGSTWDYYTAVLRPQLAAVGVDLQRVPKEEFATVDLYSEDGELLLPVFTTQNGAPGKLPAFCSDKWKLRVVQRWLRAQGVERCDCWIGISVDEMRRLKASVLQWFQYRYVLIERRKRRSDCVELVRRQGWPDPPRSACWMCSNQGDAEWREMRENRPAEFAQAVAFDYQLRETDPHAFLHGSCLPLDQVDFTAREGGMDALGCASGLCMV